MLAPFIVIIQFRAVLIGSLIGSTSYFTKNAQGDILGIYDEQGVLQAQYVYDTWGKVVSVQDADGNVITDPNHIGHVNPIRYRGYYYDNETGYYYLQTRYYNSEWGRFLNADGIACSVGGVGGNNMFAYCENNPIMFADHGGQFVLTLPAILWGVLALESGIAAINEMSKIDWSGFSFSLPEMSPVVTAPAPYLKPPVVQTPASSYPAVGAVAQAQTKPQAKSQAKAVTTPDTQKKQNPAIYYVAYLDINLKQVVILPSSFEYGGGLTYEKAIGAVYFYANLPAPESFQNIAWGIWTKGKADAKKLAYGLVGANTKVVRDRTHVSLGNTYAHFHIENIKTGNRVLKNVHFWFGKSY